MSESRIEIDTKGLDKLARELSKNHYVDVGILKGQNYPNSGMSVAQVGLIHETGTLSGDKIPRRSWLKMPLEKKGDNIANQLKGTFQKDMENADISKIFGKIGIAAENIIQEAFESRGYGTWKALEESTIDNKGSSMPLIDTGLLRKSITSKVGGS